MNNECPKSIYVKLLLLMMQAKRTMHQVIERNKLTPVQGTLLMLFVPGEGKSMHSLSSMMGCDASNITGLVDRLESTGYIERTVDPKDRRIKVIQLTPLGTQCREELLSEVQAAEVIDMNKLTPEESKTFESIIDKLLSSVQK